MVNAVLIGYGKMGQQTERMIKNEEGIECVGILDPGGKEEAADLEELLAALTAEGVKTDVIIDFSHPDNLDMILRCAEVSLIPLVIATTGYTEKQTAMIKEAANSLPVVLSSNLSIGVSLMQRIVKEISDVLGEGFDIEIIEKHHNQKIDAPSGTAKMLAAAMDGGKRFEWKCGREGYGRRAKEIGIHSVRGGSIAGEHTVIFAGEDEVLEITHKADSRQIFARGAMLAAKYIINQPPGLYDMKDVLFGRQKMPV
jgi:4-hydroxy-tetrahydrodipicolinate reductase